MNKTLLAVHVLSVIIASSLLVYLYAFSPRIIHMDHRWLMESIRPFAGIGASTGFWLMAKRSGKSESVVLAISTVVGVAVFLLSFALVAQVLHSRSF
jgi:hypothetical protein